MSPAAMTRTELLNGRAAAGVRRARVKVVRSIVVAAAEISFCGLETDGRLGNAHVSFADGEWCDGSWIGGVAEREPGWSFVEAAAAHLPPAPRPPANDVTGVSDHVLTTPATSPSGDLRRHPEKNNRDGMTAARSNICYTSQSVVVIKQGHASTLNQPIR